MFAKLSGLLGGGGAALAHVPKDPATAPTRLGSDSMWLFQEGVAKADGKPVSIFTMEVASSSADQLEAARNCVRRMKTLRHPSFLLFIESAEDEKKLQIVTESVVPLAIALERDRNMLAISWGLHQVAKAIGFLVDSEMKHRNICLSSMFVDAAGEWKVGGLELLQRENDSEEVHVKLPTPTKYAPPEKKGALKRGHPWSDDMWGFGCLIWEVFNGELPRAERLTDVSAIPKKLLEPFVKLIGANPRSRPSPSTFISEARNNGKYLDNDFVNATFFLEEINLKSADEVSAFYKGLPSLIDGFPRDACVSKILPQLLQAFNFGGAGAAVLGPLFKIGTYLDADEYREKILPCVLKLFSSTDRATRISLLRSLHLFIEHLSESLVSEQIYPQLSTGFTDSVPAMREESVKSMLLVVPKLTDAIIDNQLLRQFARLQMDETPSIRVNTTICLGKIATYLSPVSRERVLATAFTRSLKDNFNHSRSAGLMAISATMQFYSTLEIVQKLLPSVGLVTIDVDTNVKAQALDVCRRLLDRVEQGPSEADSTVAAVSSAKQNGSSSWNWASSAVSAVFSKTTSQKENKEATTTHDGPVLDSLRDDENDDDDDEFADAESGPHAESTKKRTGRLNMGSMNDAGDDGWDDDGSDYGDGAASGDGWGDDNDDLDLDHEPVKPTSSAPSPDWAKINSALMTEKDIQSEKPRSGGIKLGGTAEDRAAARAARKAALEERRAARNNAKKSSGLGAVRKKPSGLGAVRKSD